MPATSIKLSVNVPYNYEVDVLTQQLTDYAQRLIKKSRTHTAKRHYKHEALCGVIAPENSENELVETYLQEKYNL